MAFNLLLLILGLALLLGGGDLLVRGASALARSFGISPLVVGLTVVAFGTSAPELSVNLMAAFQDNSDISFGNIIGSNIANIGLILGLSALVRPLAIQGRIITREIPIMLLASVLILLCGMDALLRQTPNMFDRTDGLVLLLVFCVFLFNLLFIAGLSATVNPITVPAPGGWQDLVMMVFSSLFLLPLCLTDRKGSFAGKEPCCSPCIWPSMSGGLGPGDLCLPLNPICATHVPSHVFHRSITGAPCRKKPTPASS
jgi:Ca2+/Na+ antiporter